MNIFIFNKPKTFEIKNNNLYIESEDEFENRVKISNIENIVIFNNAILNDDILDKLEKSFVYKIDNHGNISYFKYPKDKILKKLNTAMEAVYLISKSFMANVNAYSKMFPGYKTTIWHSGLMSVDNSLKNIGYAYYLESNHKNSDYVKSALESESRVLIHTMNDVFRDAICRSIYGFDRRYNISVAQFQNVFINFLHSLGIIYCNYFLYKAGIDLNQSEAFDWMEERKNYPKFSRILFSAIKFKVSNVLYESENIIVLLSDFDFKNNSFSSKAQMIITKLANEKLWYNKNTYDIINNLINDILKVEKNNSLF